MTRKPFKELHFSDAFTLSVQEEICLTPCDFAIFQRYPQSAYRDVRRTKVTMRATKFTFLRPCFPLNTEGMFAAVMEDPEICRGVLERILNIPLKSVKARGEATLLINSDYRGIRLDVLADDEEGRIYDIEMQLTDQQNLPKRSRAYQSRMDLMALKPGEDFNNLPTSYVIFICTFDPFGYGYWRYSCYTHCKETGKELGDMAYKIFLNTKGSNTDQEPPELVRFLHYVENAAIDTDIHESSDSLIHQIETRISHIKHNNGMEVQYMLFSEMLSQERREGRDEGRKEGHKEAQESLLRLITAMAENGDSEKIPLLSQDSDFLNSMYLKYHISTPN